MFERSHRLKFASKLAMEYRDVQILPPVLQSQQTGPAGPKRPGPAVTECTSGEARSGVKLIGGPDAKPTLVPKLHMTMSPTSLIAH